MPRLDDCSNDEVGLLFLILSVALELPDRLDSYAEALGEMRRKYFKKANPKRGRDVSWRNSRGSNGCVDGHQIRVTDSVWKGMK